MKRDVKAYQEALQPVCMMAEQASEHYDVDFFFHINMQGNLEVIFTLLLYDTALKKYHDHGFVTKIEGMTPAEAAFHVMRCVDRHIPKELGGTAK